MNFSVLLSLYIKEKPKYLEECFQSLLEQTLPANEVVLVLDGPITTELMAVVDQWRERLNLKIVALPINVGLGAALNEGLKACSNDIVARMDTDDICVPERFEKQISRFSLQPNLMISGGQIYEFNGAEKNIFSKRNVPLTHEQLIDFSKKRSPFNHMTVMYRKSFILSIGGYVTHLFMEDYNLWLRAINSGAVIDNDPSVLVHARAGGEMLARRHGVKYIKSEFKLYMIKKRFKLDSNLNLFYVFILRASSRFLPIVFLSFLYKKVRRI